MGLGRLGLVQILLRSLQAVRAAGERSDSLRAENSVDAEVESAKEETVDHDRAVAVEEARIAKVTFRVH